MIKIIKMMILKGCNFTIPVIEKKSQKEEEKEEASFIKIAS